MEECVSRRNDLEKAIRESYYIICEYETNIRLSSDPRDEIRARRIIDKQRALIQEYQTELRGLIGYTPQAQHEAQADGLSAPRDTDHPGQQRYIDPFDSKMPVKGERFYGRSELVDRVFRYLQDGQSVSLVGGRRIGKTSILLHLDELKAQFLSEAEKHLFVYSDLSAHNGRTDAAFWHTLLRELEEKMDDTGMETAAVASAKKQLGSGQYIDTVDVPQSLFRALAKDNLAVTFLLDEFEGIQNLKQRSALMSLKQLRYLATDRNLSYVFASQCPISEIEERIEEKFSAFTSPLYNILNKIIVPAFSRAEAKAMVFGLLRGSDLVSVVMGCFWADYDLVFLLCGLVARDFSRG
jgi:hypothetical protein